MNRPVAELVRDPSTEAMLAEVAYLDLAKRLGFMSAELIQARLWSLLHGEGIKVYDLGVVDQYLQSMIPTKHQWWHWRALRPCDVLGWHWGLSWREDQVTETYRWHVDSHGFYAAERVSYVTGTGEPYDRIPPFHALELVERIEGELKGFVSFFVSDYTAEDPDPFLMVMPKAQGRNASSLRYRFVIDAWDVPGFGAVPQRLGAAT